jgi:hypothetical protein
MRLCGTMRGTHPKRAWKLSPGHVTLLYVVCSAVVVLSIVHDPMMAVCFVFILFSFFSLISTSTSTWCRWERAFLGAIPGRRPWRGQFRVL